MSKCFIENMGGGRTENLFAAIGVTYPAGSTLTCTNGSKTFKSKTTTGQWVFAIPEAGTWTVTATDGTNTKSQSVSITSEGQFESVVLSYRYYLFKSGSGVADGLTFNQCITSVGGTPGTVTDEKIIWSTAKAFGNQIYFTPTIDISKYKKLVFDLICTDRWSTDYTASVGVGNTAPSGQSNEGNWSAKTSGIYNTTRTEVSVDVSSVSGTQYVKLCANAITGEVYNIWLE